MAAHQSAIVMACPVASKPDRPSSLAVGREQIAIPVPGGK
jgi:hypothetical protein